MIKLKYQNGRYEVACALFEAKIVKFAGFLYDFDTRYFYTYRPEIAVKLDGFVVDLYTARKLELDIAQMRRNYEMSYALKPTGYLTIPIPEGMKLLPYQAACVETIVERKNVLLADDQGTGKTVEVLAALNVLKPKCVLIMCPATIKYQWAEEIKTWCTTPYKVQVLQGQKAMKIDEDTDIVIVNYEILKHQKYIFKRTWALMVPDECDYLINEKAQRTKAFMRLRVNKLLNLSGTPGDTPIDLWVVLRKINIDLWGDWNEFATRYCDKKRFIMGLSRKHKGKWDVGGASNVDEFNFRLRSTCMIRRLKKDVLPQLPPITKELVPLDLEADATERVQKFKALERELVGHHILNQSGATEGDYERAVDMLFEEKRVNTEGSCFASYRRELGELKIPLIKAYIDMNLRHYDKILVVTYHREVARVLHEHYKNISIRVSARNKQEAIHQFQTDSNVKIIFGPIRSIARGVDGLQKVCHRVILAEIDWSLINMLQIIDRLLRMGLLNPLLASYLVLNGTLEVRIAKRYLSKKAVYNQMLK